MRWRRSSRASSEISTRNGRISVADSTVALMTRLLSAERPEGRSHLGREELRLLPGGEVAALVDLVEVADAGIRALDPAARGLPDLAGECREADGDRRR